MTAFNGTIVDEFRANHGVVGGHWDGTLMLLLHTVGRRTGKEYVDPIVVCPDGDSYLICASFGGAQADPLWLANLEAAGQPAVIELGDDTLEVDFTVVRPDEPGWADVYRAWRAIWPEAADYEKLTTRKFPMLRLVVRT
jgi:deazaflavin-dependent oxidoreductase (nitroreductase family)